MRRFLAAPGDANLSLTKSDSPDPVTAGNNLTYTLNAHDLKGGADISIIRAPTFFPRIPATSVIPLSCRRCCSRAPTPKQPTSSPPTSTRTTEKVPG